MVNSAVLPRGQPIRRKFGADVQWYDYAQLFALIKMALREMKPVRKQQLMNSQPLLFKVPAKCEDNKYQVSDTFINDVSGAGWIKHFR
ncbi:MAG: hypothetical protein ACLTGU_21510 [Escherichia coli]